MPVCPNCDIAYLDGETHTCNAVGPGSLKEKSLPLAIGLNLVLPGLGYMYMGRVILGLGALLLISLTVMTTGILLLVPVWLGVNVIMAIDMVILVNKNKAVLVSQSTKKCPYCAETIQRDAIICRFCRTTLGTRGERTG